MPSLTQWNPFREMDDLLSRLQRGNPRQQLSQEAQAVADWAPVVDIAETDKQYTVKAELAGVAKDAVKVDVQNGVLTLSGERKFEKDEQDQKHHRIERAYGGFTRSFTVPDDVEIAQISAEFKDGVLTVALPKAAVKKPSAQRIEVRGG